MFIKLTEIHCCYTTFYKVVTNLVWLQTITSHQVLSNVSLKIPSLLIHPRCFIPVPALKSVIHVGKFEVYGQPSKVKQEKAPIEACSTHGRFPRTWEKMNLFCSYFFGHNDLFLAFWQMHLIGTPTETEQKLASEK